MVWGKLFYLLLSLVITKIYIHIDLGDERVKKKKNKMMARKNKGVAVKDAIRAIGLGYDLTNDLKLKSGKNHSILIAIDDDNLQTTTPPSTNSFEPSLV